MSRPSAGTPCALIVVPAWNEQPVVAATVREIRTVLPGVPVLVVDDGSTDRTAAEADAAGALVLRLPYNLGVGAAMRAGFRYAVRHGYSVVVQVDADGQHDPRDLPNLLAAVPAADVVIGARRFTGPDGYRAHGPRRWAMLVLAAVLSRLARTPLTDTTSGFRVTAGRALPLFAEHYPAEYLGDTVESLVIAVRSGLRITEVPTTMRPRRGGQPSHAPGKSTIYLLRAAFALLLALVRRWDNTTPAQPATPDPTTAAPATTAESITRTDVISPADAVTPAEAISPLKTIGPPSTSSPGETPSPADGISPAEPISPLSTVGRSATSGPGETAGSADAISLVETITAADAIGPEVVGPGDGDSAEQRREGAA